MKKEEEGEGRRRKGQEEEGTRREKKEEEGRRRRKKEGEAPTCWLPQRLTDSFLVCR